MAFCPSCGKKTEKGFCRECKPASELKMKDISVKVCAVCRKYFYKNKWVVGKTEDALVKIVNGAVKGKAEIIVNLPDISPRPGVNAEAEINIEKDDDLFVVPAKIEFTYCDSCAKKQGRYFEGTLQLRNVSEDVMDFIHKYLKANDAFATNLKELKLGYDMDISDQRKLQSLGQQLKKTFGGNIKVSIRQFTQDKQTSKQIYRVNVLYECPKFRKGDVVKTEKGVFQITNISEKISAIDLKTGKKTTLDFEEKEAELLPKIETRVAKVHPSLEVLDPETFQNVSIVNKAEVSVGEKVKIVNDSGLFYVV